MIAFIDDYGCLSFAQGSIVRLLTYKDLDKSYYVDFTTSNKSVEYDGTVESLATIIQGVYSRLEAV
jgi:hypothetical protein